MSRASSRRMNFLDLFSGICGFSLGAYWAGWGFGEHYTNEIDPYCVKLSKLRFPDSIQLGDSRKWREWSIIKNRKNGLSPLDSPARTYQSLDVERELKVPDPIFGLKPLRLLGYYDPNTHSLKTLEQSLFEDSGESLVTLPRSGTMRAGRIYELPTWVHRTGGKESGLWPTPRSSERGDYQYDQGDHSRPRASLSGAVKMWPTPQGRDWKGKSQRGGTEGNRDCLPNVVSGSLNPMWVEWLMGYPIGWTDLKHSEIALYLKSQNSCSEG